jgi:hypothetical protein
MHYTNVCSMVVKGLDREIGEGVVGQECWGNICSQGGR